MKERLKEIRKEKGLTLRQVADMIHVTESAVSKFEHGANLSEQTIELFCSKLRVRREWLESGIKPKYLPDEPAPEPAQHFSSPAMQALISAYNQLDENGKQVFEEYARNFVAAYHAARQTREDEAFNRARSDAQASSESEQTAL